MYLLTIRSLIASSVCAAVLAVPAAAADATGDWPQFLGPNRDAVSTEKGLNLDWEKHPPKVLWKIDLGPAFSSVAVKDNKLITMAKHGDRDAVVRLNPENGKEIWTYDGPPSYLDKQKAGAGPRATPTIVGDKCYCQFASGELVCLTTDKGALVWETNILKASGAKDLVGEFYYWGVSTSPLVEGNLVITQPGGDKDNSIVAFDRDTGKLVWGVGNEVLCYASPIIITANKKRQIVVTTGKAIYGLDPAKGDTLWRYEFGNMYGATCASPVWKDDTLFLSDFYSASCVALELVQDGDKWTAREKWKNNKLSTVMTTSVVLDGHLYGCHGNFGAERMRCLDLKTGEMKWDEKQPRFSLIAAEGHLICLNERGTLKLVEANPKQFVLKGELKDILSPKRPNAWAVPTLANKRLYIRDEKQLLCLDLAKE